MSSYTQLMALSQKQTAASQQVAATAAAELQRKLDEQKKARAVREAKERELELRLRKKRLEEGAREEERQARKEQERQQKLDAIARREAAHRDVLLYGPKKAKSESSRQPRGEGSKGPRSSRSARNSESPEPHRGPVLTREELREQKRQAEMRRTYADTPAAKRSTPSAPSKRKYVNGHMPGGAVPIVTTTVGLPEDLDSAPGKTIKEKIASVPLTLTKLNIVKRDVRTIDEILRDRAKERAANNKVLTGAEARDFSDWFSNSKSKKKEKETSSSVPPSRKETPPVPSSFADSSQKSSSESSSRSGSIPAPGSSFNSSKTQPPKSQTTAVQQSAKGRTSSPTVHVQITKQAGSDKSFFSKSVTTSSTSASVSTSTSSFRKRPRSPSFSPEPAPKKRATGSAPRSSYLPDDVLSIITGGRGRSSSHYQDDDSDESDMEADVAFLEDEERISARAAKKEDQLALQELKKREEEKKHRRLQRERELAANKKV